MRLVIFGASGNCGRHLVRLAAARGHAVTAVVRDGRHTDGSASVTVAHGDVLDPVFVAGIISRARRRDERAGHPASIPVGGASVSDDFISRATAHIVDGMRATGVTRISAISAAGVADSRPVLNLPMRFLVATSNVGVAYADLERVEQVLRASGLDWQAVARRR